MPLNLNIDYLGTECRFYIEYERFLDVNRHIGGFSRGKRYSYGRTFGDNTYHRRITEFCHNVNVLLRCAVETEEFRFIVLRAGYNRKTRLDEIYACDVGKETVLNELRTDFALNTRYRAVCADRRKDFGKIRNDNREPKVDYGKRR